MPVTIYLCVNSFFTEKNLVTLIFLPAIVLSTVYAGLATYKVWYKYGFFPGAIHDDEEEVNSNLGLNSLENNETKSIVEISIQCSSSKINSTETC